jgi:hypothetical protein
MRSTSSASAGRAPRAFASGIVDIPAFCDQTEEPAPIPESRLDRVVGQIVQGEISIRKIIYRD